MVRIKLDHDGMAEMLLSAEVADVIAAATEAVAAGAADTDGDPYPVAVHHFTTDRAAGSVSIPAAAQAVRGTLGKAALAAGLEVTEGEAAAQKAKKAKRSASARKAAATRRANAASTGEG